MREGTLRLSGRRLGIYDIGTEIGRGGMGTVYSARTDPESGVDHAGAVVALKVFDPGLIEDERTFQRLLREAELGMRIRHPNVVRTFEIGSVTLDDAPVHYIAMELVEGQTLRDLLIEIGTVPEHLIYQIADQALDALSAVHAEGMIHRDVKPENLVLTGENRLLLMDLGVARLQQEGRDLTRAGEFVGSIAYAAPEQFLDQDHVSPAADLYAFGVVLYEMATGKNPFGSADLSTLIQQKVKGTVRRPKTLQRDLDPFLDDVIQTCLRSDPTARFASCAELREILQRGERSEWWLERIKGETFPAAGRALKRLRPPREVALIGRGADLDLLHQAYDRARGGQGALVLVSGAARVGKSRLLHDFLEELVAPDGPVILAGRCPEEAGSSYQAFIDAARNLLGGGSPLEGRLSELLPDLLNAVPKFALFLLERETDMGKEMIASAYATLLRNLTDGRTVIFVIEDLHRGGPETADLFGHLARSLKGAPVLLVGSYREEEVAEGSALHMMIAASTQLEETLALHVEPLTRDTTDELVRAFVQRERTVRAIGRPLYERSDGNPHILLEMLAHLKTTGSLVAAEDGLAVEGDPRNLPLPASIRDLLAMKLEELDDAQRGTLEAAAVQGYEFEAELLASVTDAKRIRLLKQLAVLERKHRLILSSGKDAFRFVSRGLHHVVYEGIAPGERERLHARCADSLLEQDENGSGLEPEKSYALVRHLLAANRMDEAKKHLASAVEYAAAHHHPAHGVAFLEGLIQTLDDAQAAVRLDAYLKLAHLHELLGRQPDRMRALDGARVDADRIGGPGPSGRVHAGLAAAFWRAGNFEKAETEAKRGLELAKEARDRAGEAGCLHTLGAVAYRRGSFSRCAVLCKDALVIRRAIGDRRGEANTLQALGAVMMEIGEGDVALATKQEALNIFRDIGDRRGEGGALNNYANSLVDVHRVEEALVCYEQAIRIAREVGDLPAEAAGRYNRGRAFALQSRIEEAQESLERALELYREIGDPGGQAEVLDELGSSIAAYGERDEALAYLQAARETASRTGQKALLARSLRHLANVLHEGGDKKQAWRHYQEALALAAERGRRLTRADMGNAALNEGDYERAVRLLAEGLGDGRLGSRTLLILCRLARAYQAAGHDEEAKEYARRAEKMLNEMESAPPQYGPEVYYSLGTVFGPGEGGEQYLARANELLGARTRSIRSVVRRQHYLTMTWPNREILEEARRAIR